MGFFFGQEEHLLETLMVDGESVWASGKDSHRELFRPKRKPTGGAWASEKNGPVWRSLQDLLSEPEEGVANRDERWGQRHGR